MDRRTFETYIAAYNANDLEKVAVYFDPEIVFENFGGHQEGPAVIAFLRQLHGVVSSTFTIRRLLIDGGHLAMEADCLIEAHMDLPHLPIGPMRKGEKCTVRTFAFYETQGDKFLNIKVAGWPPVPGK